MVFVVSKKTNMILNRCDAWISHADERMAEWALSEGYEILSSEITFNGDMVIWVS